MSEGNSGTKTAKAKLKNSTSSGVNLGEAQDIAGDWSPHQLREFVQASCTILDIPLKPLGDDVFLLAVPSEARDRFGGAEQVAITFDKALFDRSGSRPLEYVAPGGRTLDWLVNCLRHMGGFAFAACQAKKVDREKLAALLQTSYEVVGGKSTVELLEISDRELLWSSYLFTFEGREPRQRMFEVLVDDWGRPLSSEMLGLDERGQASGNGLAALLAPLPLSEAHARSVKTSSGLLRAAAVADQLAEQEMGAAAEKLQADLVPLRDEELDQLSRYFQQSRQELSEKLEDEDDRKRRALLREQLVLLEDNYRRRVESLNERYQVKTSVEATTRVAARREYFHAKLRLSLGAQSLCVAMDGWPDSFTAPTFACPTTGVETRSIGLSADGRMVATSELELCELTGGRYPRSELRSCNTPRKRIHEKLIRWCPASGVSVAESYLEICQTCQQKISPGAVFGKSCRGCMCPETVDPSDERLQALLAANPQLASWGRWKLSEGAMTRYWTAGKWLAQVRLVSDKRNGTLQSMQTRSTPFAAWTFDAVPVPQSSGTR